MKCLHTMIKAPSIDESLKFHYNRATQEIHDKGNILMKNKFLEIFKKKNRSKIICLTAYSKNIAQIIDKHCDIILVGDSLGSVLYNYKSTRSVTLDIMIEHSKSVRMGIKKVSWLLICHTTLIEIVQKP